MKKVLLLILLVFACGCASNPNPEPQPASGKLYYEWRATELEYFESFYVNKQIEGNFWAKHFTYRGSDEIVPCSAEDYVEYRLLTEVYDRMEEERYGWSYHVFIQDYKGDWYSIIMHDNKEIAITKYSE